MKRRRRFRTVVRCCALVAAVILLVPLTRWTAGAMLVPAVSPFVAMATSIATRSLSIAALVGLPVLVISIVRRRWFCRWVCPVGLLGECVARISPVSAAKCRRVPPIGRGLVLASISASVVGYPLLLWLDPLAIFSGPFSLGHGPLRASAWVGAAALGGVVVLSFPLPGLWCRKLCPLGATQELLAMPRRIASRWRRRSASPSEQKAGVPTTRRSLLAMSAGAVCAGIGARFGWTGRASGQHQETSSLRPPGAVQSWQFAQLCLRCGNCARACPAGIIRPDWSPQRITEWLTPRLVIEDDYCREDCSACMQVCPSGAIAMDDCAAELQQKLRHPIGRAEVVMDRCLLALGRECRTMCREVCPYDAITLHEWTWEDDRRYPIIDATKCPGCGACVLACQPMDAITILPHGR